MSVVEWPKQIVTLPGVMETVGTTCTVTVVEAVPVQPAPDVPVTVYVVVTTGEMVREAFVLELFAHI